MATVVNFSICYGVVMQIFKRRRQEKQIPIRQLADLSGASRSTLWRIEQGICLPDPLSAAKLRELLALPGLPDSSQILGSRAVQSSASFDFPRPNQSNWERMEKSFSHQIRQLRVPQTILDWMKECLSSDSPRECLALCGLAADGATPQLSNPHMLGYRRCCITDREGLALGERMLPGLQWNIDGVPVLMWPQVSFLTAYGTYRSDLLMAVQGQWPTAEIDAKPPDPEYERYRSLALGNEPFRYTNEDVRKLQFVGMLREALREKLNLSKAA